MTTTYDDHQNQARDSPIDEVDNRYGGAPLLSIVFHGGGVRGVVSCRIYGSLLSYLDLTCSWFVVCVVCVNLRGTT